MKFFKKASGILLTGLAFFIPATTLAVTTESFDTISLASQTPSPESLIVEVINFILRFGAALAVLMIIIGGILYMVSGGNDEKTKKAKSLIFAAVIGLVIILLAIVIVNFTTKTTKNTVKCPPGSQLSDRDNDGKFGCINEKGEVTVPES